MILAVYNPDAHMNSNPQAPTNTPTRRDVLISAALLFAGSAALAGINLSTQQLHEVSAEQLVKDPAKFGGQRIQTNCTLQSKGVGNLVYPNGGVSLAEISDNGLQEQQCELFAVKGLACESFLISVALGNTTPPVEESLQIEGVISEARLNGKSIFVLTPRTISRAPLPGPIVPF